jgi:DNA-binding NarL/FixJ family response regulator
MPGRLTARVRAPPPGSARGLTNTGIAATLSLSESAVEKHIGQIFAKLGHEQPHTHRRVAAVLTYLRATAT